MVVPPQRLAWVIGCKWSLKGGTLGFAANMFRLPATQGRLSVIPFILFYLRGAPDLRSRSRRPGHTNPGSPNPCIDEE
jgi:hypothetical protein